MRTEQEHQRYPLPAAASVNFPVRLSGTRLPLVVDFQAVYVDISVGQIRFGKDNACV